MIFDQKIFVKNIQVPNNSDLGNIFDCNLNNSVFNPLSIEKTNNEGEVFFNKFLKFLKIATKVIPVKFLKKPKLPIVS
jgi:hypothetical protein